MARPRSDFLPRLTPLVSTLDPNECWEWLGNISRSEGGIVRKDGTPHREVSYVPALLGGVMRVTPKNGDDDPGLDLRYKVREDYIKVRPRNRPANVAHPPMSYMGEMLSATAAIYHFFRQPTLYGYLPCKEERLIKKTYLTHMKRGGNPQPPMFEGREALCSMFEDVQVRRARSCPDHLKRKFPNGLFCCNPWHAGMWYRNEKPRCEDDRLLTPDLFDPIDTSFEETPEIVAQLMFEWLDDLEAFNPAKFLELFKTEDRSPELFSSALTVALTQKDVPNKWRHQLQLLLT